MKKKKTSAEEFVVIWQTSGSRKEVAEALGIVYGSVISRERRLRQLGVQIKKMPRAVMGPRIDPDALNKLISQLNVKP